VVRWGAALATLLLASSHVLAIWAPAGLEAPGYALLFYVGLSALAVDGGSARRTLGGSAALAAAALTRPEGVAFWLAGAGAATRRAAPVRRLVLYALPGLAIAAHFAWRLAYYGLPWPNTYYAKTGGGAALWAQGLSGLGRFVASPAHWPWLAASALGAAIAVRRRTHRRLAVVMGAATLAVLLWIVSVGDDGLRVHRFYVPVLAPLALLAGLALQRETGAWLARAATAAMTLAIVASLFALHADFLPAMREGMLVYQEGNAKLGRWLASNRPPDTAVAVAAAGAIPYYSGLPAIDMYGLCDPAIARRPFAAARGRLMKWDNAYVLARRPDLIVPNLGYFPAGDSSAGEVARNPGRLVGAPADRDLLERLAADGSYALRPIELGDGSVFWVFERR
jgi:arabinofuranosyltransferase